MWIFFSINTLENILKNCDNLKNSHTALSRNIGKNKEKLDMSLMHKIYVDTSLFHHLLPQNIYKSSLKS